MFRELNPQKIVVTAGRLRDRIRERFPTASLADVATDLLAVAKDSVARTAAIRRRDPLLRLLSLLLLLGVGAAIWLLATSIRVRIDAEWPLTDALQGLEAGLGTLFFLGATVVFLLSLEQRSKRRRCLNALHEMRAMAHIVDMHQLTKDPDRLLQTLSPTPSSPTREHNPAELSRYLDYCSEMLSLIGKVAALYVQGFPDPAALAAVDDVEDLTTSLSRKIWQKIMIIEGRRG
jgi:hypothetical protein